MSGLAALEALVNVTRPATAVLCALAADARTPTPDRDVTYSCFVDKLLRQKLLLPALVERLSTGDLELSDLTVNLLDQLLIGSVETSDARIPDRLEATEAWRIVAVRHGSDRLCIRAPLPCRLLMTRLSPRAENAGDESWRPGVTFLVSASEPEGILAGGELDHDHRRRLSPV